MAKSTSNEELGERIERLVQEHIETSRRAAQQAVARAFASTTVAHRRAPSGSRCRATGSGKRRSPTEIAALGDRLYRAVCEKPGETMAVLAADVGASARELHRPMSLLKRDGRVRSVGQRHLTRYFPLGSDVQASA